MSEDCAQTISAECPISFALNLMKHLALQAHAPFLCVLALATTVGAGTCICFDALPVNHACDVVVHTAIANVPRIVYMHQLGVIPVNLSYA